MSTVYTAKPPFIETVKAQSVGKVFATAAEISTGDNTMLHIVRKHNELPPKLHPHSLRHTFVSTLISQGVDVAHVASLAGDTVEVISKVYAHALKEYEARAMDKIGAAFQQIADAAAPAPKLVTMA